MSRTDASNTKPLSENTETGENISMFSRKYPYYALFVLLLINVLILLDRQIVTVLAEDIKADLGLSDAEIGFVYGTALAVFYSVFSIPIGRLADVWVRKNLVSICVALWSVMIFLTGTARNLAMFAMFRAGVGIGEAGGGLPAISMIGDYFPPRMRSTALAIFAAGVPIGGGLGLWLGGWILESWNSAYPDPSDAPFGLLGWQASFFLIAVPGPLLAIWLWTLREPKRGESEGIKSELNARPLQEFWHSLQSIIPIVSLVTLARSHDSRGALRKNLLGAAIIAVSGIMLVKFTGNPAQWAALGLGMYCILCWSQNLAIHDPATFSMVLKCPTLIYTTLGVAGLVFVTTGVAGWVVPFMIRVYGVSAAEAGGIVGFLMSLCGLIGNLGGGVIADALETRTPRAKVYVLAGSLLLAFPAAVAFLMSTSAFAAYVSIAVFFLTSTAWYGVGPSIVNSLVMPRMRGVASAFYLLVFTMLGVALGPFLVGFISDQYIAAGASSGMALRNGMLFSLAVFIPAIACFIFAGKNIAKDQSSRLDRARALGEAV